VTSNGAVARSAALAALFPPGVVAFERREPGDLADLLPSEAACCAGFAPKRAAEFAAGRACAHAALAALGRYDVAVVARGDRSPDWPPGIVGSISHTSGFCAAVAAPGAAFAGIGIDVEIVGRIAPELWDQVFVEHERERFSALPEPARARAASIAFCAKEAFYKCQYAVTAAWVDFQDADVDIEAADDDAGRFVIRAVGSNPAARMTLPLSGRFRIEAGLVAAGVAIVRTHDHLL
jgi:4'-phosphopantetheinyl transferase EntD